MYIYLKTLTPCVILGSSKHLVKIILGGQTKFVKWSEIALVGKVEQEVSRGA